MLTYSAVMLSLAALALAFQPIRPNIVLIVADDLGWGDVSCYTSRDIPTPNIDRLAETGVRLTQGYVTCSVCAPSRAGLITGRYQQRFGFETNPTRRTRASCRS